MHRVDYHFAPAALVMLFAWCAALGLTHASARAQPAAASAPASPSDAPDTLGTHAWFADRGGADSTPLLIHLPPRDARVTSLAARPVRALESTPEALAATPGGRVFVFTPPVNLPDLGPVRRVASVEPVRGGSGVWNYNPAGRMDTHPLLPGGGAIRGAVGTRAGPVVLLDAAPGADPAGWSLRLLADSAWRSLDRPPWLLTSGLPLGVALLSAPDGFELAVWEPGQISLSAAVLADDGSIRWAERSTTVSLRTPRGEPLLADTQPLRLARVDGTLLGWTLERGRFQLFRDDAGAFRPLAVIDGVPPSAAVVPLQGLARIALLWRGEAQATLGTVSERPILARQVSTLDGRVLGDGAVPGEGLLSSRDLGLLGAFVLLLLTVSLLFILRREGGPALALPPGTALASPLKRLVAAIIDLIAATLIASVASGKTPSELWDSDLSADPQAFIESGLIITAALLILGTLSECLFSRTLGKLLVGTAVVGLRKARPDGQERPTPHSVVVGSTRIGPPSFGQALVRNLVKWVLTPLTVMILIDPNLRHLGDVASRTLVIEPADEEGPAPDDDGPPGGPG